MHDPAERNVVMLWLRAVRLRCPRCGEGKLFVGWFHMHERCVHCDLKFERSPGYFLGSTYFNYGQTALTTTVLFVVLQFGCGLPKDWIVGPLVVYCIVWPLFWFRYARALWMAMDCFFDSTDFDSDDDVDPEAEG